MSTNTTIWLVEERDYDDYTLHAAFTTEELANEFSRLIPESEVSDIIVLDALPTRAVWYSAQGTVRNGRLIVHVAEHPCWSHQMDENVTAEHAQDRRNAPDPYVWIWAHGLTAQAAKDRVETLAEPYLKEKN